MDVCVCVFVCCVPQKHELLKPHATRVSHVDSSNSHSREYVCSELHGCGRDVRRSVPDLDLCEAGGMLQLIVARNKSVQYVGDEELIGLRRYHFGSLCY